MAVSAERLAVGGGTAKQVSNLIPGFEACGFQSRIHRFLEDISDRGIGLNLRLREQLLPVAKTFILGDQTKRFGMGDGPPFALQFLLEPVSVPAELLNASRGDSHVVLVGLPTLDAPTNQSYSDRFRSTMNYYLAADAPALPTVGARAGVTTRRAEYRGNKYSSIDFYILPNCAALWHYATKPPYRAFSTNRLQPAATDVVSKCHA